MKKTLSLLLVAVLVLSLTVCGLGSVTAARPTTTARSSGPEFPIFSVDTAAAMPGSTFTVPVRIEANPGIVSLKLALEYDADVLELVEAVEQDYANVSYGPTTKNPFIINWLDTLNPDNTTNGTITNLTFRVKEDAAVGHYLLSLSYDLEDVYNASWDGVAFATQDAYVSVVDFRMGDMDDDGRINNRDLGLLLQYVNAWDVYIHDYAADVTGDGRINNRDLGLLQQHINGWDVVLEYPEMIVAPEPDVPATTTTSTVAPTTRPTEIEGDVLGDVPNSLIGQKVKMLIWWTQATDDAKKAEAFKKATGIQVAYETAPMDNYQSTLSAKIMANNPPALAAVINEWYPVPITRGLIQPIENTGWDYSNKDDDIYDTALMDQFSYKGEHYGIALKGSAASTYEVMFYNKDLLAQYGVEKDPYELWKEGQWNWDTCLTIAKQCTDAKNGKYGLSLISQFYWMLSAGQDFVLSDINGLKNNIKSSNLLSAWTHAWDMINTHKVVDTSYIGQNSFYQQQAAMLGGGSYLMQANAIHSNYVPQNCKFDWGVVPFPSPKRQAPVAACEGTVWGFPVKVKGDKLQAAMWWLRYYLDDAHYADRDFLANEQCWEVLQWMSQQKVQSYNSVGVLTYGGNYNPWSIQYSVIDEAATKTAIQTNLHDWYDTFEYNISAIESELS